MLAADPELEIGACRTTTLGRDAHKFTDAFDIEKPRVFLLRPYKDQSASLRFVNAACAAA